MEVVAAGVLVGGSAGFHYGYEYNLFTENSMFFEADVGNIAGSDWNEYQYSYGICAYPDEAGGQEFMVTNYRVGYLYDLIVFLKK
jgi:hypothetical protein